MATHDYVISNASGAAVRADLNNALAAIVSNNSNATEPSTTYAYQWWADTGSSPAVMKLRNAANDAWIELFQLDGEWSTIALEDGTAAAPSLYFKDSGTDTGIFSPTTDEVAISTNGTERMRINSSGSIYVHTTTNFPGSGNNNTGAMFERAALGTTLFVSRGDATPLTLSRTTSDGTIIAFNRNGIGVGTVTVSTTATAYNTSSDYRLKENVVPLTGAVDRLNQLQVHRFNFIADPDKTVDGFIAHEVQAVVPECATGEKDAVDEQGNPVYQGIDQSKLVPLLTAALQEAVAKIETLEARVAALEGA